MKTFLLTTKQGRINNSTTIPLGSGQPTGTTESQSRRATVQTEEEDEASHGESTEIIKVGASKPDNSSPESNSEASEDELGQQKLSTGYISETYISNADDWPKNGHPQYMHFLNKPPL